MCQDKSEMEPKHAKMSQERPRLGQDDGVYRQDGVKRRRVGLNGARRKLVLRVKSGRVG